MNEQMELFNEIKDLDSEVQGLTIHNLRVIISFLEEVESIELQSL